MLVKFEYLFYAFCANNLVAWVWFLCVWQGGGGGGVFFLLLCLFFLAIFIVFYKTLSN